MMMQQKFLLGKLFIKGELVVETGLHIGGGGENLDIGGLDKPVIRDPLTRQPYIPGSSLKGKLRSILERLEGKPINRKGGSGTYRYESDDLEDGYTELGQNTAPIKFTGARNCPVSRVFGSTGNNCWLKTSIIDSEGLDRVNDLRKLPRTDLEESGEEFSYAKGRNSPAHLIVRDCHLLNASRLEKIDTGLYMTEWKFENGLDRITAAANPRQIERVPKGARFDFEMVYTVESENKSAEDVAKSLNDARTDLKNLLQAIFILEDDALGGHGSRGYGKVSFENLLFHYRDYRLVSSNQNTILVLPSHNALEAPIENTSKLPEKFNEIQDLLPTV
ncbi:type III-A CRISPR-associated RAMP protein Csm3 [Leptolyngbya sp. 'hensonii']|uniref:type III-A CRISPR-associated RAMP protein Csm3 n=1 Tax=Leptolyngbya sp. 'hensonii' TaxID=1922337 RepID=UPI00094FF1F3|nr:type III-A CRISPR-associated RAMP protein Csm3 [Leptolyngbya sp. 'hensonii']OLP19174.1 type III-A CRISPR-associated RAMP protein Csm3 [Leptolyngbya sp. 'hensonii']